MKLAKLREKVIKFGKKLNEIDKKFANEFFIIIQEYENYLKKSNGKKTKNEKLLIDNSGD